jgi:monooxygenase
MARSKYEAIAAAPLGNSNVAAGVGDSFNTFITVASAEKDIVHLDWSYSRACQGDNDPLWMPDRAELIKAPQHLLKELRSRDLVPPFSTFVNADDVKKDKVYNWRIRSVFIHRTDLDQAANLGVVFIGDSVHAMPIFGGEGGNHAILDGVELFRTIKENYGDREEKILHAGEVEIIAREYYGSAVQRGQDAVRRCVQRFSGFHKPIQEWIKITETSNSAGGTTQ